MIQLAQDEFKLDFIDARIQKHYYEIIVLDNGVVRDLSTSITEGVGVRVVVDGSTGYSSTSSLHPARVKEAISRAYKIAKASSKRSMNIEPCEKPIAVDKTSSRHRVDPELVDFMDKIEILRDMYKVSRDHVDIASSTIRFGYENDSRIYVSSRGDYVEFSRKMIGIGVRLVAHVENTYETLVDQESEVAGWEFIERRDWGEWIRERCRLVVDTARSPRVKPGRYDVVLDNDMVGLMLHEAFGHASEGDTVIAGGSVLAGRIGERVASELVSIVDDGLVEGGCFIPYDDEGTPKKKTYTVKNGVLTGYLHSSWTPRILGGEPTGNARVMSYRNPLLVRQTNTYMEPGDWRVEEMIRDMGNGLYVRGRGALGGQVNPLTGAFTFTSGPSYIVENGELVKLVKGIMLSGLILETLRDVDAVGRDLVVKTSVFGGCGKDGQIVRVGDGGPHVRVRGFTIGG